MSCVPAPLESGHPAPVRPWRRCGSELPVPVRPISSGGGPSWRQERADLPFPVWRCLRPPGAERERQRVLRGHGRPGGQPAHRAAGRGARGPGGGCGGTAGLYAGRAARLTRPGRGGAVVHGGAAEHGRWGHRPRRLPAGTGGAVGDPVLEDAPAFDIAAQTAEAQAAQFGYNNDFVGFLPLGARRALLVVNHEYTNEELMFPGWTRKTATDEQRRIALMAHGMSVVQIERAGRTTSGCSPMTVAGTTGGSPRRHRSPSPARRGGRICSRPRSIPRAPRHWGR